MVSRRCSLILPLLAVPALIGCQPAAAPLPPLSPAALQAVSYTHQPTCFDRFYNTINF